MLFRSKLTALAALLAFGFPPLAVTAQEAGGAPAPAVFVEMTEKTTLNRSVSYTGKLKAFARIDIISRVSGFLEVQDFQPGQAVKKNDRLYKIEQDNYEASVRQAKGALAAAVAVRQGANIDKVRTETLVQKGDAAQAILDFAVAQLGQADGDVDQLKGVLEQAEIELGYTQVSAPFDGIIGLSSVDVGAFVSPETGVLVTLTQLDPIYVEMQISSARLMEYTSGSTQIGKNTDHKIVLSLTLPDGSVYDKTGYIDYVATAVTDGTDTVTVRGVFENPEHRLFDGAFVKVSLQEIQAIQALTVPLQAIQRDMVGAYVLAVSQDGTVSRVDVKTGAQHAGRITITSGLEEGVSIITEGLNKVQIGMKVDAALKGEDET